MQIKLDNCVDKFAGEIESLSGFNVYDCYQCGKCSAGCPVSRFIDESPTRLLRLIQLNQKELVLNSKTPYLCATCNTCSGRCPMQIDITRIMETIRIYAKKNNIKPPVEEVNTFSEAFLDSVRSNGRLFEFGMTLKFNLNNKTPFLNAELGPVMLRKGKLSLRPQKTKNSKRLKDIFNKSGYFEPKEESKKEH
jgi:heterodisulfide reductase subunit C